MESPLLVWLVVEMVPLDKLVALGCKELVPPKAEALLTLLRQLEQLIVATKEENTFLSKNPRILANCFRYNR